MQGKRIARRRMLRERRIAGDELGRADKIQVRRGQCRHMQRLANVASGIGTIRVMVQERAARSEIQYRRKGQQRQSAVHGGPSENGST